MSASAWSLRIDGLVRYCLAEISHERRNGYAWYVETPREDGLQKIREGITTVEEVLRVTSV